MGVLDDTLGVSIPSINTGSIVSILMYAGVGLVVLIGLVLLCYWIYDRMKYNRTIVIFKKINNRICPVGHDKAKLERIGLAGDYWLKTKKFKKILPRPRIECGVNTFWYYEREDGEWINFSLKDIDEQMREAGAYFTDEDMRLQRLGIEKNLRDRLVKEGFWAKYGTTVMTIVFLLIVTVCLVVLFQKMTGNWSATTQASLAIKDMALAITDMNICGGGGASLVPTNL